MLKVKHDLLTLTTVDRTLLMHVPLAYKRKRLDIRQLSPQLQYNNNNCNTSKAPIILNVQAQG